MIKFEPILSILNYIDPFRSSLNKFDPVWTFLNKFDQFGSSLNQPVQKGVTNALNGGNNSKRGKSCHKSYTEVITRRRAFSLLALKSDFLKVGIFHFQYINSWNYILSKKLRFLRNSGKTTNSAYSLISIFLETGFHPYISPSWSKKKFQWSH